MNKNLIVVLYFGLAAIGVIILGLTTIFAPEQIDKTVGWVVQVLGLASTAAVTIYLLGKQATVLEEVKTQTNGNLTALRDQLAAKDAELAEANRKLLQVVESAPSRSN